MLKLNEQQKKDLVNKILYHIDKSDDVECKNAVVTIRYEHDKNTVFEIENFRNHVGIPEKYVITALINNQVRDSIIVEQFSKSEEFTKAATYIVDMCLE